MPIEQAFNFLFWLLVMHAVADYPLQGDWLAKAKNPWGKEWPVPGEEIWLGAMASHCLIHAAGVYWVTQTFVLAAAEFVMHFIIDLMRCFRALSYNEDQALHIACKVAWTIILYIMWWGKW